MNDIARAQEGNPGRESGFSGVLPDLLRHPVTGLTCALAAGFTFAWWSKLDVSSFLMESRAFGSQPWRLVTSTWLHVSAPHLVFNLYWTWHLGRILERTFGVWRTLAIFLFLSVGSSAAEFAFARGGVGLSGLGYGLFGMLWVLRSRDPRFAQAIRGQTIVAFVVWLVLCIAFTLVGWLKVGNVAHLSGLGLGAAAGMSIGARPSLRPTWRIALLLSCASIGIGATVARPYVNFGGGIEHDLFAEGYRAHRAEQYERAIDLYRRALQRNDDMPECWCDLALACGKLGRDAEAADAFEHVARLAPNDPKFCKPRADHEFHLAYESFRRGDSKAAIASYEKSVDLDPSNPTAWFNLGIAYQAVGRYDGAISAYQRSLELDPKKSEAQQAIDDLEDYRSRNR